MKLFIRYLLLFTFTCLLGSAIIICIETLVLNKQKIFVLPKEKKYIFLGHSHAQAAYNDKLIDSSLNLASAGEAYFYTYIKLKKILESNEDKKIIFIEYANNTIVGEMNNWIWDDVHIQYRYRLYSAYTHYDEMKLLYSKNPKSALVCNIKSMIDNVYYMFKLKNIAIDQKMGGYSDLVRDKTDSLLKALSKPHKEIVTDTTISDINIAYLKKIIETCRQKGVEIYLIRSPLHPQYEGLRNEAKFKEILNTTLQGVEFLDFRDFPLLNSEFGDLEHTNYRGAKKYSMFLNKLLKSGLMKKDQKQKFINEQIMIQKNLP
jgi:hypothetical protein